MRKTTKLMSKLFSDSTPNEFKEDVMDKIEEAKENGTSEYSDDESELKMESDGEEVKITDTKNGNEVTVATPNPNQEGDVQLKAESDTAPDVQVPVAKGIDGEHIENSVPDVEVKVDMGITDEGKAGLKAYSIKFYGQKSFSDTLKTARAIAKAFSECPVAATRESLERSANTALDNADATEEEKEFAEQVDAVAENANELAKAADDMEDTQDPELAKTVKEKAESLVKQCNELKSEHPENCEFSNVLALCKRFSDSADEIISKTNGTTEAPTESPTKSATEDPKAKAKAEELKDKAQKIQKKSENLKDDDKKGAEEVKEMCNDLMSDIEDAEDAHDNLDTEELKDKVASYSNKADEVIKNAETKEAAEDLNEKAQKVQEKAESVKEGDEKGAEELKQMCNDLKSDIEDAEEKHENLDTEELKDKVESYSAKADAIIAKQVRNFSQTSFMHNGFIPEPAVKLTGEQRSFSRKEDKRSINPYLFS